MRNKKNNLVSKFFQRNIGYKKNWVFPVLFPSTTTTPHHSYLTVLKNKADKCSFSPILASARGTNTIGHYTNRTSLY